jgi:pimeloyl-ACP methyl ester carboxylesterase
MVAKIADSDFRSAVNAFHYMTASDANMPAVDFHKKYQGQAASLCALKLLSHASIYGSKTQKKELRALKSEIIKFNTFLAHHKIKDLEGFQIRLPKAKFDHFVTTITRIFRIAIAIFSDLILVPVKYILISIATRKVNFNPSAKKIKNGKIPIVLIHGSGFNDTLWIVGRQYLRKKKYGSVFSFNLDKITDWDPKKGIDDYAKERVSVEMKRIKELTGQNEVILIGHSMGGMVAGYYAENCAEQDGIKVKHVISIASPWKGSPTIDKFMEMGGGFAKSTNTHRHHQMSLAHPPDNDPKFRKKLVAKALSSERRGVRNYYNIWSTTDMAVPRHQGSLSEDPRRQRIFNMVGHYYVAIAPSTWFQVQSWLNKIYQ